MLRVSIVRRLAAVAVASALVGGCGSESPTSEAAENPDADYDQAAAVVREYVDAISADDVDAAMTLRCGAARPAAHLMDQFADELRRLEQAMGPIEGVKTRPVTRRLEPADALPDPVHVGYRIVVDGNVTDEMIAVTVVEDGQRRLCGHATAVSQTWAETLPSQLTSQPATSAELVDLMPDTGPPGLVQVEDQEVPVDEVVEPRPGLVACWTVRGSSKAHGVEPESMPTASTPSRTRSTLRTHFWSRSRPTASRHSPFPPCLARWACGS